MRILTWNLNGLDDLQVDERTEAAVFIAVTGRTLRQLANGQRPSPAPDVLLFQEVTARTFTAHLAIHLPRAGYQIHPASPPARETFEVIAVRSPARIDDARTVPLERSLYGRQLQIATVTGLRDWPGVLRVLTAHFDSGPEEGPVRLAAARQVFAEMGAPAVFGGDTNLRSDEWDHLAATAAITDVWEAVGSPKQLARTWRMASRGARFDRIWATPDIRPVALTGVGQATLPGLGSEASDHIGLIAEFDQET